MIIKQYPENMEAKRAYNLTRGAAVQKLSTAKGQTLEVAAYVLREEADQNGELKKLLSIETKDGDLFATNSGTAIREFESILDCGAEPDGLTLRVVTGRSRAGREYLTLAWE